MIEEAIKRGYNGGIKVKDLNSRMFDILPENPNFQYLEEFNEVWVDFICLYSRGQWAEIIKR